MPGTLYIVGTPIGNLEDITHRAVRILREADLIACEDTRHTRRLLDHYGVTTRAVSYHEHNERERAAELVGRLEEGVNVALVSDAGTPLIADPGYRIVREARQRGIAVVPIPGPSAIVSALCASGLPTDAFCFIGFLPAKGAARRRTLESLAASEATLVFYEAPHRVLDMLDDAAAVFGDRPLVIARELTKSHEEFLTGTAAEVRAQLASRPAMKGEFTVMVGKGERSEPAAEGDIENDVAALLAGGMARMDAMKTVARQRGISKRDVYRRLEE